MVRLSNAGRFMLGICAVLLAGCGGAQPPGVTPATLPLARAAKGQTLLYISNAASQSVYVYAYPAGTPVKTLTGFGAPAGICVDPSQNVWIVDAAAKKILEYAHGGTTPIATLADPSPHAPFACAVDPRTGDLAVTTGGPPYGNGGVLIYPGAQGSPKRYPVAAVHHLAYDGYDPMGNLFVDGLNGKCCERRHPPVAAFAELPQGSSTFAGVSLSGGAFYPRPGGIAWDGTYITVVNVNVVYQLQISGSHGDVVGSTELKEANSFFGSEVSPDFILDGRAVAADYSYDSNAWNVGLWRYPRGGLPLQHFSGSFDGVYGLAISLAK
ncbi:MAG: hypothetical protein WA814_02345 [Candidatus Baltobacteraceae bacterium]